MILPLFFENSIVPAAIKTSPPPSVISILPSEQVPLRITSIGSLPSPYASSAVFHLQLFAASEKLTVQVPSVSATMRRPESTALISLSSIRASSFSSKASLLRVSDGLPPKY